jgi:hypothetical protein
LIDAHDEYLPDFYEADLILVGCENPGKGAARRDRKAPDCIREQFYQLFYWHPELKLADAGNIRTGATPADTQAALKTVLRELTGIGMTSPWHNTMPTRTKRISSRPPPWTR